MKYIYSKLLVDSSLLDIESIREKMQFIQFLFALLCLIGITAVIGKIIIYDKYNNITFIYLVICHYVSFIKPM